jgi:excisionase family DNA binding protein
MTTSDTTRWLTRKEAAAYLRCDPTTLDRWVKRGLLTRHRVGDTRATRYSVTECDALMKPEDA